MTPNDIATDISGLKPVGDVSNIATMTVGTTCYLNSSWTVDDANQMG